MPCQAVRAGYTRYQLSPCLPAQPRAPRGTARAPMSHGGYYQPPMSSVEAYRASPVLGGGGGGARQGRANAGDWRGGQAQHGPELYGFLYAGGWGGATRLAALPALRCQQDRCTWHAPHSAARSLPTSSPHASLAQPPWPAAEGLPAFEGTVAAATAAGAATEQGGAAAAAAALYLAHLCRESLAAFQQQHSWRQEVLPSVETGGCCAAALLRCWL